MRSSGSSVRERKEHKIALKLALADEISTIITLMEWQKYLDDLSDKIKKLKAGQAVPMFWFLAKRDYAGVYRSNSDKIGSIGLASKSVASFYFKCNSFLEDLDTLFLIRQTPIPNDVALKIYEDMHQLLSSILHDGREALDKLG